MKYIGVDLGSSYVKAVLLDLDQRRILQKDKMPSPARKLDLEPNYYEIPAGKFVDIVKKMIDGYTKKYLDIDGVIISTQMHGFIYQTKEREDIYISWQDMRCMNFMPEEKCSYLEWMESKISQEEMRNNGVYLKPSLAVCNLFTLLETNHQLPKTGKLYTIGSYIIHALTGSYVCHISNAAPLGIADVVDNRWDKTLLEKLNLEGIQLPELVKNDYEVCGEYVSNGYRLKVFPDYGDMQVSILGSGIGKGEVVVNVATGAQVIRYDKKFVPGAYEIRPYFDKSYLYTISNMPSGRNLDVLIKFLQESIYRIIGKRPDIQDIWHIIHEEKLTGDPNLTVETSFYKNPYFKNGGAIKGITHSNLHLNTLFYAAFYDMATTYWHFIKELGAEEKDISRIVCAGGVNWKTPEIRMMLRDVTGKRCELSPIADEAFYGMFLLSLLCSGQCRSIAEAKAFKIEGE